MQGPGFARWVHASTHHTRSSSVARSQALPAPDTWFGHYPPMLRVSSERARLALPSTACDPRPSCRSFALRCRGCCCKRAPISLTVLREALSPLCYCCNNDVAWHRLQLVARQPACGETMRCCYQRAGLRDPPDPFVLGLSLSPVTVGGSAGLALKLVTHTKTLHND